jgi:AAA domain-containing protein/uncharacterized protein DUF2726
VVDPRREAILVRPSDGGAFEDKTYRIEAYQAQAAVVHIRFSGSGQTYPYRWQRIAILRDPVPIALDADVLVEVRGSVWKNVTEVLRFDTWWRIFYSTQKGDDYRTYPDQDVRILRDTACAPRAAEVVAYWRKIVSGLPKDDPLRKAYAELTFVHPESALGRYLNAEPITDVGTADPVIFPFSGNLSQRQAVEQALRHAISVVEGPPGTGKTQTILNLIANIISSRPATVAVVSFNNAAVDNVRDKLVEEGYGYVVAGLGRREKRLEFFEAQQARNAEVDRLVGEAEVPIPPPQQIADLDRRLQRLREVERRLAMWRQEIDSYRLEQRHFGRYLERHELPELADLPLLRRSSGRILDYLAETATDTRRTGRIRQLIRRVRAYLRYGPTASVDPGDTDVVLALQRAYYDRKIAELLRQIERAEQGLGRADFAGLAGDHQRLSAQALRAALQRRYATLKRTVYSPEKYRRGSGFSAFSTDYPVILSTCHSLARSVADGCLLDYLIIDEASQVDLLTAALALACARTVVVVGDLRQLPHIADEAGAAGAGPAPVAAYDYGRHSILSSLIELYGPALPRTMLREHYRCDPAIIGFCNKKFYDGQLVPFTVSSSGSRPLIVVRTVEGNHMRQHREGGRSNQREVDVIAEEVIPRYCADTRDENIGITTPYRRQVDKIADALIDSIESDTVHKFQGRQKDVVIMTTVLDETWRGRIGTRFVDDPHLVNVAVSRAARRFVLVTNHRMLPSSRNLRDLIGYIEYNDPDETVVDSTIVSVFDLLYRDYSVHLQPLARRLETTMQYRSENIMLTVLHDILAEEPYTDFFAVSQVLLRNLLADLTRLTPEQADYARRRASVDFVVYNRITMRLAFAIEVDGFRFHEDNPAQQIRDSLKNAICAAYGILLLRLPTTGSGEHRLIRGQLDAVISAAPASPV